MTEPHDQLDHFEEFEEFGDEELHGEHTPPQGLKAKFGEMWRNSPAFKFGVIAASVAAVGGGGYMMTGGGAKPVAPDAQESRVSGGEHVKGTVGADTTPEYNNLLQDANKQRAKEALQSGQSAIPTPVGNVENTAPKKEQPVDPLAMWRQAEQQQPKPTPPPAPILQQEAPNNNVGQQQQQDLSQLTTAMQQQISALTAAWQPTQATVVSFATDKQTAPNNGTAQAGSTNGPTANGTPVPEKKTAKVVVPAGDILYGTMITEANSDVPGPILAQIMSGPLKDGRLIGAFQVSEEYLVMQFTTLSLHGHSYAINALALDPNTTLGGMATETDQRYFSRLVLPAAAAFISRFGQAISQPPQTTTVSNGTVTISQGQATTKDALYGGMGDAASQVSQFVSAAGNAVKPLVRVASNTPIGIFFTKPVTDQPQDSTQ